MSSINNMNVNVSEDRFNRIDFLIEQIGYRPLARRTGGDLSASHINRVLRGKSKTLVLETLKSIARAAQLPLDDVIFYVERQREYVRKVAA